MLTIGALYGSTHFGTESVYEVVPKSFRTESLTKYKLTIHITHAVHFKGL